MNFEVLETPRRGTGALAVPGLAEKLGQYLGLGRPHSCTFDSSYCFAVSAPVRKHSTELVAIFEPGMFAVAATATGQPRGAVERGLEGQHQQAMGTL